MLMLRLSLYECCEQMYNDFARPLSFSCFFGIIFVVDFQICNGWMAKLEHMSSVSILTLVSELECLNLCDCLEFAVHGVACYF